jgi:hypothetical protein
MELRKRVRGLILLWNDTYAVPHLQLPRENEYIVSAGNPSLYSNSNGGNDVGHRIRQALTHHPNWN